MKAAEEPPSDVRGFVPPRQEGHAAALAFAEEAREPDGDVRTLPVMRDAATRERWRDWKSVTGRLGEEFFDDWPLEGPRTVRWMAKEIAKAGGGPLQHHQRWKAAVRGDEGDRSVHEHELLCLALELAGCYDQLDIGSLAAFEVLGRRLQLIEESKAAGGATAYEGAKFFLGYRRGGTLLAPGLGKHVAHKLQEEVSVMEERRKHLEERSLAKTQAPGHTKPPGNNKNSGGGGDQK